VNDFIEKPKILETTSNVNPSTELVTKKLEERIILRKNISTHLVPVNYKWK